MNQPSAIVLSLLLAGLPVASPCRAAETPDPSPAEAPKPKLANTLKWKTASEVENFGYDVYRGDSKEGPFVRLTKTPIRGAGTTDVPTSYSFTDDTIEPDKEYFYYVESIAMSGVREIFTPVAKVAAKPALAAPEPPAEEKPPAAPAEDHGGGPR